MGHNLVQSRTTVISQVQHAPPRVSNLGGVFFGGSAISSGEIEGAAGRQKALGRVPEGPPGRAPGGLPEGPRSEEREDKR